MFYIWVPILFLHVMVYTWLSVKNNHSVGHSNWMWVVWIWGCLQLWPFVSKYSKNLLFDALLFDIILLVTGAAGLIYLGEAKAFNVVQWLGVSIVIIGFVVMKIGEVV